MFIRSQDRSVLLNTEFIFRGTEENSENKIICMKDGCDVVLGEYCCADKAKEVLDMIQDSMEDGTECQEYSELQQWNRKFVFEMPAK